MRATRDQQVTMLERESELGVLEAMLDDLREGAGQAALIEGPAGIGKTEILRASRDAAADAGLAVLTARGIELEEAFPFGVASQLLTPPISAASPEERRELLSGAAGHAAPLLDPEISAPAPPPGADPTFTLQHGLYWVVANLAAEAPLVLAVDDVHWGDRQSLRWLDFLVKRIEELPILLLMTARTGEGSSASPELESIRIESSVSKLQPDPLSAESAERLLRERLSADAGDEFYVECHSVTGGNPLLLNELVKALEAGVEDGGGLSAERVSEIGPEAIARHATVRVAAAGPDAVELAKAVAVLNGGAEVKLAAEVAGIDHEQAAELAASLERAGVLRSERPLAFVHPIVRAAIHTEIPAAERALLNQRAAELLIERDAAPERVGAHLLETEPGSDPAVVDALTRAADVALSRGDAATAKALLERALREPPDRGQRAQVLRTLAQSQFHLFEPEAIERIREAVSLMEDEDERAEAIEALLSVLTIHGRMAEACQVGREALEEMPNMDPDLRLEVAAQVIALARQGPETAHVAREVIAETPEGLPGRTRGERMALAMVAFERGIAGDPMAELEDIVDRAGAGGDLYTVPPSTSRRGLMTLVHTMHFLTLVFGDRLDEAESVAEKALRVVTDEGRAAAITVVSYWRAMLFFRQGRVADSIAEAETMLQISRTASAPAIVFLASGILARALVAQGDIDRAEQALASLGMGDEIPGATPFERLLHARGEIRLAQGRTQEGVDDLLASWHLLESVGILMPGYSHSRGQAGVALAGLGEHERGAELAAADLELARRSQVPSATGTALRFAGLAEGGTEGLSKLREAVEILEATPVRLEHARALVDLGAALRRGNERAEAREYLRPGLELARACGATALAEQAREELVATGARPRSEVRTGVDSLTPSELRVARMAAEGNTNKEIAQALFVTLRTVETHLTHVFQKLDLTSRKQLPDALATPG